MSTDDLRIHLDQALQAADTLAQCLREAKTCIREHDPYAEDAISTIKSIRRELLKSVS